MIALLLLTAAADAADRETALDHAAWFTTHQWSMTSDNVTASCSSGYESQYSPGTYTALPYDWGGYMYPDEFDDQIDEGYGAGSHSWHGVLSCTAGVDCSGFLSSTWEAPHNSTSTFHNITHEIALSQIDRADAFNKAGSHCVLFAHETGAGVPIFYEAAGTPDKVRVNGDSGWSYLSGYDVVRYDDIEDGPETGTASEPLPITSFPFTDLRWTAGAASDAIDSYSCAPDTDESGPEMLYTFQAATSGTLEVVVSDESGVDIDVHVMTAPSGDACLARDDTSVSLTVGPGEVWISLDTYVGSREYPGPYLLTATFTGELGEPQSDPDTGGGDDGGGSDGGDSTDDTGGLDTDASGPDGPGGPGGGPGSADPQPGGSFSMWSRTRLEDGKGCAPLPLPASGGLALLAVGAIFSRRKRGH